MKKFTLLLLALFAFLLSFADGWRKNEMEVRVNLNTENDYKTLYSLHLNCDLGQGYARAYVIPSELELIKASGLTYEVLIDDLNKHYQDFWLTEDAYHTYDQIIALEDSLVTAFPSICQKTLIGTSLQGRQLAVLKISDNVSADENEAEIMFDGGIHGDEIGGPENLIRFARDLCIKYGVDPVVTNLINNREIFLYVMVNPDGRANMVRYNANGVDLNRDYGYMWDTESPGAFSQHETRILRDLINANQNVIYTSYHSGTEFISYPWSYRPDACPDNTHINHLAALYANTSGYSSIPYQQGYSGMYPINGSTKDGSYGVMGSVSWSLEISLSKQPPASQIMMYYNYNYPSMIKMIEYSGYGLAGTVTDAATGQPIPAAIYVNNSFPSYTDPLVGDYHKFLVAGTYTVKVVANGYLTQTISNVAVSSQACTTLNVQMVSQAGQYANRFPASQIPGNNFSDEGRTCAALGPADNVNYSIGKNGWCVLDMGASFPDAPGMDFKVIEGDATPEGYTCYAGMTMDGPWYPMGTGTGTTEFDLQPVGLIEARFIKILDDGDGSQSVADAGFDLDAVQVSNAFHGIYLVLYGITIDDATGNNNGRLDPGEQVDLYITLRNNGDSLAKGVIGGLTGCPQYITIIDPSGEYGDIPAGESATAKYTISVDPATPIGYNAQMSLYVTANSGAYQNIFDMTFVVGLLVEDFETGNFSSYPWSFAGNANWTITSVTPYEGLYSARSGVIGNSQNSEIRVVINVATTDVITFHYKVSSESGYDFLRFYIDNTLMGAYSGEVPWTEISFPVTAGNHTFRWVYIKDSGAVSGSDCAWIDYIVFPPMLPPAPAITVSPLSLTYGNVFVGDNLTKQFTISNTGSAELSGTITTPDGYAVALGENVLQFVVASGATKTYNLTFSPAGVQSYNGNVVITHNAPGGEVLIAVTGAGVSGIPLPYTEDFEESGAMPYGWTNATGDDFDWTVYSGATPSSSTGPDFDHTTGTGYYVYTESSSPNYPTKTANLLSPVFDLSSYGTIEAKFWYHMYGSSMGVMHLDIFVDGAWQNDLWSLSGNQGNTWIQKTVNLSSYAGKTIKLRFRGVTGSSYTSDMAIDDFQMTGSGFPTISLSTNSLSKSLYPDATADDSFQISNVGTGSLNYTCSVQYLDKESWLTITGNGSGSVSGGASKTVTVHYDAAGMLPGTYGAQVVVNSNDPANPSVTVGVTLEVLSAVILDLKAYLEGPFEGSAMYSFLNIYNYLPLAQPYNVTPWNYTGTEAVGSIPNANVVDWILVELRQTAGGASTATSSTMIARQACFVLKNGSIVGTDGSSKLFFTVSITQNLYVVVWHRNHLGIMSSSALLPAGITYTYDFSNGAEKVYGGANGHKLLAPGIYGMTAGDGNRDGNVSTLDKVDVWKVQTGLSGYKEADFNMNGQVDNVDKIDKWAPNAGRSSQVPG